MLPANGFRRSKLGVGPKSTKNQKQNCYLDKYFVKVLGKYVRLTDWDRWREAGGFRLAYGFVELRVYYCFGATFIREL